MTNSGNYYNVLWQRTGKDAGDSIIMTMQAE